MEGTKVKIGEREFTVARFTNGRWLKVYRAFEKVQGAQENNADAIEAMGQTLVLCLEQCHPGITAEEVLDLFYPEDVGPVFAALFRAGGKQVDDKGESPSP